MEIKTKYNLGQQVYVPYRGIAVETTIVQISVHTMDGTYVPQYTMDMGTEGVVFFEFEVFSSIWDDNFFRRLSIKNKKR